MAAIEKYYSEDVNVFENRRLARSGRVRCAQQERENLAKMASQPRFRARGFAADELTMRAYIEWSIRFVNEEGRNMLLEEVAVQKWDRGQIVEERFYYEGFVDEGE